MSNTEGLTRTLSELELCIGSNNPAVILNHVTPWSYFSVLIVISQPLNTVILLLYAVVMVEVRVGNSLNGTIVLEPSVGMGQQRGKSGDKVIMVSEFRSVLRHVVDQVNLNCKSIRCNR